MSEITSESCASIAVSHKTQDTYVTFNLYHTSKTVRLKVNENTVNAAINFIKGFELEAENEIELPRKKRFFKFF